jgi:hypothetical protein
LWRALDETLERPVRVAVFDPALPRTADVLDAARRVTLAKDPRLAQVLDVGRDGGVAFVVSENLPGRTLTQALSGGAPLPAAEARRLVGEAAEALSGAAHRGLHHQRLAPETLVVGTDGSVKLTGTAVEAAATGAESRDSAAASRVDALGLVCVLYAALTGRWPGTTPSDLPAAPRVGGRPVPPGELVPGIPADLDDLCTQTLANAQNAPVTPAEVAERLSPWPGAHPLTDPRLLLVTTSGDPGSSSTGAPTTTEPAVPQAVAPSPAALAAAAAAVARIRRAEASGGDGAAVVQEATSPAASTTPTPADSSPTVASPDSAPTPPGFPSTGSPRPLFEPLGQSAPAREQDTVARGHFQGWDDLSTIGRPVTDDEPLVPFAQVAEGEEPPGSQSRFVIVVVVGFVVLVVVIALISLSSLGSPSKLIPKDVTGPLPTATSGAGSGSSTIRSAAPTPSTPATEPSSSAATPSASPQLVGAQAIDPQGDGSENDSQASRAVDGDASTAWKSQRYQTADFGGLKDGVGLVLSLGAGDVPDVQQVVVDVAGSGGTVELRTTPTPGFDGSTVVAQAPIEGGRAVLTPAKPVNSRLLLLWFTKLPKTPDGKYQLIVSEINVR